LAIPPKRSEDGAGDTLNGDAGNDRMDYEHHLAEERYCDTGADSVYSSGGCETKVSIEQAV
jgi:hypothetical protein